MVTHLVPETLVVDMQVLRDRGYDFEIIEENPRIFIVFKNYPLPKGAYNLDQTDLLVFTTPYYPNAGFDMFWVDEKLLLKNGAIPQGAGSIENYRGRNWRRFSYHPYNTKQWNPSEDSAATFIAYVEQRLQKGN